MILELWTGLNFCVVIVSKSINAFYKRNIPVNLYVWEKIAQIFFTTGGSWRTSTMKDAEIKRLLSANIGCIFVIILTTIIPSLFLENFSILGTHLAWLCICSASVGAVNIILYILLKPSPSTKRSSLGQKVRLSLITI